MTLLAARSNRLASHDQLTGLGNRSALRAAVERRLADPQRPVALLLLGLDRFKDINDALGHDAGDAMLCHVAQALHRAADGRGAAFRLGGDEFAVLLDDLAPPPQLADLSRAQWLTRIARGVLNEVRGPFTIDDVLVGVEGSVGVAYAPEQGADLPVLLRRADTAMYTAKRQRTAVEVWQQDLELPRRDDLHLLTELRAAISAGELRLHFQPLVDAATRRIHGAEALVRWQHPQRGLLPPGAFVAQAERSDVIFAMTEWVLDAAIRQAVRWWQAGRRIPVSVNVSAACLAQDELVPTIAALLRTHAVPADLLTVEVTESAVMTAPGLAAARLTALRELGVRVSIDDFGTGYTSLALLTQLPIDELKLDRTFVSRLSDSPAHTAIVYAVAELARRLGVTLVGEGVEDESTATTLRELRFDVLQGYHFARPLPAEEFDARSAPACPGRPTLMDPLPPLEALTAAAPGADEERRLAAVAALPQLDQARRRALDDLAAMAKQMCGTPIAIVNLVTAAQLEVVGAAEFTMPALPRAGSFCDLTIAANDLVAIPDATKDVRFAANTFVRNAPGLRFYAGAPIRTADGTPIGTLCVLDTVARQLDPAQREALAVLARIATSLITNAA